MRKSFEEVLDRIILEKKKKGLKYDDIVEGAKVSKPTVACLLNPKKRDLKIFLINPSYILILGEPFGSLNSFSYINSNKRI